MAIVRQKRRSLRIDLIPMIDVVFFLLVFFMVFTTFKTTPQGLDINLPKAASGAAQAPSELEVSVDKSGSIFVSTDGQAARQVNLNRLRALVTQAVEDNPDVLVAIRGDKATAYDHIVAVIDTASAAGAKHVGLAVDKDQQP